MRPNKLRIQAFGPFANTENVDFDRLGSNPLFLINGPTGSGKSSILDAICFALYGQTTGKEREATQMRCDHAPDNLLTEITMEFTLGEVSYRIRRSPTQDKPKSRGEGYTTHQTEACLWQLLSDGETVLVPKKAQEATKMIEEITGLNVEQFRQVMVLPQGKFRDFLMADSSQRENIFSKLFQTQVYKRLEDALKERASGIRKEVESLRNQIMGILQSADLNTEDEVQLEIDELTPQLETATIEKTTANNNLAMADKQLEAGKQLGNAFNRLDETKLLLDKLQLQLPTIKNKELVLKRAQSAQKIAHFKNGLTKINQSVERLKVDIQDSKSSASQQQHVLTNSQQLMVSTELNLQPVDGLKQQLVDLQKLLPKIDELSVDTDRMDRCYLSWKDADKLFNKYTQIIKDTVETSKILELQRNGFFKQVQSLPDKTNLREKLVRLGKNRAKLDELLNELNKFYAQQAIQLDAFNVAQAEFRQQDKSVKELELNWHNNQASILAAELNEGDACPVCGSTEHPALAISTSEPASKEQVDREKEHLVALQSNLTKTQNLLIQSEAKLQSTEKSVEEWKAELGDNQYQSTDQLRAEWQKIEHEVKQLEIHKIALEKHEADLKSLAGKHDEAQQHLESARLEQQRTLQEYQLAKQVKEQVEQQLPEKFRQPGKIVEDTTNLQQQIEVLNQAYEKAVNTLSEAQKIFTQITSKLEQQNKQLTETTLEQSNAKTQWQSSLVDSDFNDEADFQNSLKTEEQQQQLHELIQQFNDQMTGYKATHKQQTEQLKGQIQPDLELMQSQRERLLVINDESLTIWKQIDNRYQQLNDLKSKLEGAHKTNKALEDEYKVYGTLSDVANGQTGNKISLQRFVLSVLLDDVLIEASHRLNAMSKGRYQLLRKEDKAKGNKASGLELEVEDAYTGKTRSVATLSGGESFMAALSLALGLSDVVQAYAGGIKLDTLFIDEGFGSLDQESLDLAVKTLIDLQSTGRMIGIISHVSELREQMPLRVDVVSSAGGSKIV